MSNFGAGCTTVVSIFIAGGILSVFNLEGAALVIAFIIVVSLSRRLSPLSLDKIGLYDVGM